MAKPFENIRTSAGEQERSFNWYMSAVRRLAGNITNASSTMKSDIGELKGSLSVGSLYMFLYDPKTKQDLPYYDQFPLCIPFENAQGGWYGLNLHYLPPMLRAQLFGKLLDFQSEDKLDLSWNMLQNVSRFPGVKPTVKRYLVSQVKSRFLKVNPEHWKASIFLPVQNFQGASANKVWRDSREML